MLRSLVSDFLHYCKSSDFSDSSLETLSAQLFEFNSFVNQHALHSIQDISYQHLTEFIADHRDPSVHVKKQRVWSLRQFFHFLKIHNRIEKNIASDIPYPKIIKKVPAFLTIDEFNKLLEYAANKANDLMGLPRGIANIQRGLPRGIANIQRGLRDLVIFMILGLLGLRLKALQTLNIQDVNLARGTLLVKEKGHLKRQFCMPQVLCVVLARYLKLLNLADGPLLLSKRGKRISARTLQLIFQEAMAHLKIDKHLHAHLFRHTAATHLNKVAGPVITQFVLGHARSQSTKVYTHLNPDQYAVYMNKHPYHLM
jgi:integrase/recombinase XerC